LFSAIFLCADADTNRRVCLSSVMLMVVTRRPAEPALVTTVGAPVELGSEQLYHWWVWPETTTPYSGRRPATIGGIAPGESAQVDGSDEVGVWLPPSWMTRTSDLMPISPSRRA